MGPRRRDAWRLVAAVQGPYYMLTGVWPVLHMGSFLALTGPKRDLWLVRTAGVVLGAIGAGLTLAARRGEVPAPLALTAAAAAAGVAAVDLTPGPPRRISRLYVIDGVLQVALVLAWLAGAARRGRRAGTPVDAG